MSPLEKPPLFLLLLMLLWGYKKLTPFIPWLVVIYVLPLSWCRKKPLFIMSIFYSPPHPLEHRKLIYPLTFLTFSDLFFFIYWMRAGVAKTLTTTHSTVHCKQPERVWKNFICYLQFSDVVSREINPDSEQIKKGENWRKSSYKSQIYKKERLSLLFFQK